MSLVTERDMEDAKALGERAGLVAMDEWDEFVHDVAQAIADGRRADPLPWDANANREYEPVETRAAEIFAGFAYDGVGQKPAWAAGGNSFKQDEARVLARIELQASGHVPQ